MTSLITRLRPCALLGLLLGLLCSACEEEEPHVLPETYVSLSLQLSLPQFSSLNTPGNIYVYPREGYQARGIYVVHNLVGDPRFSAYDVTCPQHFPKRPVSTELQGQNAYCPFCKTEYNLFSSALAPDGRWFLQPYKTHYDGRVLYIRHR